MTFFSESKLGSFWTTFLDTKKQLFVSEKFLNLATEEGKFPFFLKCLFNIVEKHHSYTSSLYILGDPHAASQGDMKEILVQTYLAAQFSLCHLEYVCLGLQ